MKRIPVAIAVVASFGACGTATRPNASNAVPASGATTSAPRSVVQLGDSIASGEGILYGYVYDRGSRQWTSGDLNAVWPGPFPACHVAPDTYGAKVAQSYGAAFAQFACTGATFADGIAGPAVSGSTVKRPPEFGNWTTKQGLNAAYDAAAPDLVLVTLGADDVHFADIVTECVKSGYKHYFLRVKLECVDGNPGATVTKDFVDFKPTLRRNYATLVSWIEDRAKAAHLPVPKVVFTTYPDPLPRTGAECPDVNWLYSEQVKYLGTLLDDMNHLITSTITSLKKSNVAVADTAKAYQPKDADHRWCTADPMAYGLSIYHFTAPSSFSSQAPFHPTPEGQESIGESVLATVSTLFKAPLPEDVPNTAPPGG